jgi:hypothetical protein
MTNIKDAPLKPCPFCGAKPHSGLGAKYHDQLHGEPHQDFAIWCPKGHAKVTRVNREQATDEWNARASTASPDREKVARIINPSMWALIDEARTKGLTSYADGLATETLAKAGAILSTIFPDEAAICADERERLEAVEALIISGAVNFTDPRCAGQRGADRADALYDAYQAIRAQEAGR